MIKVWCKIWFEIGSENYFFHRYFWHLVFDQKDRDIGISYDFLSHIPQSRGSRFCIPFCRHDDEVMVAFGTWCKLLDCPSSKKSLVSTSKTCSLSLLSHFSIYAC